jgi:hypothetical protein
MDKVTKQIENMLFDVFGLCPDYKIQWIEGEWIEFYPLFSYTDWEHNTTTYPEKVRVRLNEHKTTLESGLVVSAHFAVIHSSHTIFLRILKVSGGDSFGKVYTAYNE